jgi:hypothetical protein
MSTPAQTTISRALTLVAALVWLTSSSSLARIHSYRGSDGNAGDLDREGAFTCDFAIPGSFPIVQAPAGLEIDRMYQSARRGFDRKLIPLSFAANGDLLTGGRYLFDTAANATEYKRWLENDFILNGTKFFDRPFFLNPECHAWSVIGAHDFGDLRTEMVVMRTERWRVPPENLRVVLNDIWPGIRAEAFDRGLTTVWFLYNKDERLVSLFYCANRIGAPDPQVPDFASLAVLAESQPLGHSFEDLGWENTFDRTQWVLTIWFPFVRGDQGDPSLWPNSPPFPLPSCGDGVCEVSRGETYASCLDCPPRCGDGACTPGEDTSNCPADCRLIR